MTFTLFDAPEREPSHHVGFAGNLVDRAAEHRSETALDDAIADSRLRVLIVRAGRVCMKFGSGANSCSFSLDEARALSAKIEHGVLLGNAASGPVVAVPGSVEPDDLPEGVKAVDFRSVVTQGLLPAAEAGELAQGAALLAWNASCRFCGRCGAPTQPRIGGYKRVCTNCSAQHFPRTDPVVIMLTVTADRCLMGRSPHFQPGMYSTLAGFVEPGETIENAVRRETFEESGVRIGRVAYHASQPWPFPHSLMIGCFGEALNEDLTPDLAELEDCRWFDRAEVEAMLDGRHGERLTVPPRSAIANHLISAWAAAT